MIKVVYQVILAAQHIVSYSIQASASSAGQSLRASSELAHITEILAQLASLFWNYLRDWVQRTFLVGMNIKWVDQLGSIQLKNISWLCQ